MNAIDLFCGVGVGLAMRELGIVDLGIDIDPAVIRMRDALGLRSLQADITQLDPTDFEAELLWGSPPCTTRSAAGSGGGNLVADLIARCLLECAAGSDTRADRTLEAIDVLKAAGWADEKADRDGGLSMLVVEPLRWALALRPDFLGLEQVPSVLPDWSLIAQILREHGYSTWVGVMSAERHGVPQTRKRAILMASRLGVVHPPAPTHQEYVTGEPARHEFTLEGEILPWVSMAEALGWDVDTPAPTVTAGGTASGGAEVFGRGGASPHPAFRLRRGAGMTERHGERRDTPAGEPAPVIGPKARTATWQADSEPSRAEPSPRSSTATAIRPTQRNAASPSQLRPSSSDTGAMTCAGTTAVKATPTSTPESEPPCA